MGNDPLHAGTALGDPIEVGAAFAVLQRSSSPAPGAPHPLHLQAAKSRLLHTEPAAGAIGLGALVQHLAQQGEHVMLHLRTINPHVNGVFGGFSQASGARGWAVRRQNAPNLKR
jgi:acyl transferase domain-containing protein